MPTITAVILAGGRSRRMGTDKALLRWRGEPMIQRVASVAEVCCSSVAVLTPWPERYVSLLPPQTLYMRDDYPDSGPLWALAQALQQVHTPWVLLLACDLPCLDASVIQNWIQTLPEQKAALAYVPYGRSQWEPLCGLYHTGGRLVLQSFLEQGGRAFQAWLTEIDAVPLALDEHTTAMLRNCNHPEDLEG
ncbi:MAG TPA: molybdenum cofactor guanylyltransferase [Stenomitos sp.]